ILNKNDTANAIHDALVANSKTLETLELLLPSIANNNLQSVQFFPIMSNLKALFLRAPFTPYVMNPFPLGILLDVNPFPRLVSLEISDNLLQTYLPEMIRIPSLNYLSISYDGTTNENLQRNPPKRRNLFKLFPNISKMDI